MTALRRYEILLPSQFNDGSRIPQELIAETLLELEQRFGAVSCETQIILLSAVVGVASEGLRGQVVVAKSPA